MDIRCLQTTCFQSSSRPKIVRLGHYYRTSDRRTIQRYRCSACGRGFSQATLDPCFRQHKRIVNEPLKGLLCSGVSMRRAARLLRIHRTTVARKLTFLAQHCRTDLDRFVGTLKDLSGFQFDELETHEHSRCKPLSVAMAVLPKTRKILGFEVASMPAKGLLAERARQKYGPRPDHRRAALQRLLERVRPTLAQNIVVMSDENPRYPSLLRRHLPTAKHVRIRGGRAGAAGLGELRQNGFDPLFSLNHTFAMFRANINRLFRQTWCTTKKAQALADHLTLYAHYHNTVLT